FAPQTIGLLIVDELLIVVVVSDLATQVERDVRPMASDMGIAGRLGVPLGLAARLDAVEEVAHMESRRVTTNLRDSSPRQQRRRTQHQFAAVASFDPASFTFEPNRT